MSERGSEPTINMVIAAHQALKAQKPLVQCLTNNVTVNLVANALLAAGATPAMIDNPEEAGRFAGQADAVLINLGTPQSDQVKAMHKAAGGAHQAGTPWVLDPIGAGSMKWRHGLALELLEHSPTVVRGNASEIMGLAGQEGAGRGVDSGMSPQTAINAARELLKHACAVSASGPVDTLVGPLLDRHHNGPALVEVSGGSEWQPRVSGTGCALGAIVAAYCAVVRDPLSAAAAAHVHVAVAAELAEEHIQGPGSFAVAWLDALDQVDETLLRQRGRLAVRWLDA
ncbi:hydroxyethylthiazole kinase [Kushneria pakistanensis]|nr:hydroxyethylthiazole kinase [Kushneria pakistanensis]